MVLIVDGSSSTRGIGPCFQVSALIEAQQLRCNRLRRLPPCHATEGTLTDAEATRRLDDPLNANDAYSSAARRRQSMAQNAAPRLDDSARAARRDHAAPPRGRPRRSPDEIGTKGSSVYPRSRLHEHSSIRLSKHLWKKANCYTRSPPMLYLRIGSETWARTHTIRST